MNFTDTTVSPGPTQTGFFENVGTGGPDQRPAARASSPAR